MKKLVYLTLLNLILISLNINSVNTDKIELIKAELKSALIKKNYEKTSEILIENKNLFFNNNPEKLEFLQLTQNIIKEKYEKVKEIINLLDQKKLFNNPTSFILPIPSILCLNRSELLTHFIFELTTWKIIKEIIFTTPVNSAKL